MLWLEWYQTVFLFVLYNIAILQANINYPFIFFLPFYLSTIISYVCIVFFLEKENKDNITELLDDDKETKKNLIDDIKNHKKQN